MKRVMYRGQFLVGLVYGFVLGCWDVYVGCVSEVGDVCVTGVSGCGYVSEVGDV